MCFIMRSNIYKYFFFLFLSWLVSFNAEAQVNDAGLWTSINLEKRFSKKMSLHFSEELRFNENITELGAIFSEISGEYRFNKMFSVSAGYRFTQRREVDDSYSIRHRYMINLNVKNKLGQFSTNVRIRYQSQFKDVQSSENGKIPDNYLRTKLSVKYDLGKKYAPFISGELFLHLNRPDGVLMDNYRIAAGVDYEFSKRSSIEFGYLINREIQVANPWTNYVITVGWNYLLK